MAAAAESEWTLVSPDGERNIPSYLHLLHKGTPPPISGIRSPPAASLSPDSAEADNGFVLEGHDVKVQLEQDGWLQALHSIQEDVEAFSKSSSGTYDAIDGRDLAMAASHDKVNSKSVEQAENGLKTSSEATSATAEQKGEEKLEPNADHKEQGLLMDRQDVEDDVVNDRNGLVPTEARSEAASPKSDLEGSIKLHPCNISASRQNRPQPAQQIETYRRIELVEVISPAGKSEKLAGLYCTVDLPSNEGCDASERIPHYECRQAVRHELASWEELRKKQEAVVARIKADQEAEDKVLSIFVQLEEETQARIRVLQNRLQYYESLLPPKRLRGFENWMPESNDGQGHSTEESSKPIDIVSRAMPTSSNYTTSIQPATSASLQTVHNRGGPPVCEEQSTCKPAKTVVRNKGTANPAGSASRNARGGYFNCSRVTRSNELVTVSSDTMMESLGRFLAGFCDCLEGLAERAESGVQRLLEHNRA